MRYYLKKAVLVMSLLLLLGVVLLPAGPVAAASQVSLFTKFTGFAVSPGESINYSISAINDSNVIQRVTLELIEQPEGWDSKLTAGGWRVSQISVKPKGDEIFYLETQVPLQIEKGKYTFRIRATDNSGGTYVLPIVMEVTEEGTFKTELETDQPSMQGDADSTFNFSLTLRNRTAEEQLYALSAGAPRGWSVSFESQGQKVASVKVDANGTQNISVRINPPAEIEAGKYTIPVKAQAGSFEAEINLEVDIVGTYKLTLSTPTGVLSTSATIGREKLVELQLGNNGSSELNDIVMNHSSPIDWEVRFEPETVISLLPGETAKVKAYIKPSDKAIAGDYVVNISASTPEAYSSADFRVTVKTSALWGWIGVLIIALVGAGIYYLFRRFGRQ